MKILFRLFLYLVIAGIFAVIVLNPPYGNWLILGLTFTFNMIMWYRVYEQKDISIDEKQLVFKMKQKPRLQIWILLIGLFYLIAYLTLGFSTDLLAIFWAVYALGEAVSLVLLRYFKIPKVLFSKNEIVALNRFRYHINVAEVHSIRYSTIGNRKITFKKSKWQSGLEVDLKECTEKELNQFFKQLKKLPFNRAQLTLSKNLQDVF